MTIGEYVQRRELIARMIAWGACLAIAIAAFRYTHNDWGPNAFYALIVLGAMLGVATLLKRLFVRCPRCHADLSTKFLMIKSGEMQMCQQCGVRFDGPYKRINPIG